MHIPYVLPRSPSSGILKFNNRQDALAWIDELERRYPSMPYGTYTTMVERTTDTGTQVEVSYYVGSAD